MASLQKNRRDRLPTIVYDDNYGYRFNFYNPLSDYLDSQQEGNNPQYSHTVNHKTSEKYSEETSEQSNDFRVCKRSTDTSRLVEQLKGESVLDKSIRKIKERAINDRENRKEEQKKLKKMLEEARHEEFSSSLKKAIRGKSSNEICDALLAESTRNLKTNDEHQYHEIMRREQRGSSEKRIVHIAHIDHTAHLGWMDDRCTDHLSKTVTGTMSCVKRDLQNFSSQSSHILNETRCLFTDSVISLHFIKKKKNSC